MYKHKENKKGFKDMGVTLGVKSIKEKENFTITQNKTERKNSLGARVGLTELSMNQLDCVSNNKTQKFMARQASVEMGRSQSRTRESGINPSRLLDS